MAYVLYYSPGSANLIVRMVLEELGAEYSDISVPRQSTERSAEFMRLNPRGLVPVMIDESNGTTIFETAAILLYLADRHSRLAPAVSAAPARAACLQWLFLLSNTLHAELNMRFYAERYVGDASSLPRYLAVNRRRIHSHLRILDNAIAAHSVPALLESGLSICDFYLGCLIRWSQIYPAGNPAVESDEIRGFAGIMRVLRPLELLPSVTRALLREQISGPAFIDPHPPHHTDGGEKRA